MPSRTYITEDFLLEGETARELYHAHAVAQPIHDYHCHLPPRQIADNHSFSDLAAIWLDGDHYKWRAMRANGIPEDLVTGKEDGYGRFLSYVRTLQYAVGNPLHHWSHLELLRVFGIDLLITEENAPAIWARANERLACPELSAHGILASNKVAVVGTTDDPVDSLDDHARIAGLGIPTRVYPTFRPDKALAVDNPDLFNPWCDRLSSASGIACDDLAGLLSALQKRHDDFHAAGGRLSDHGMESCFATECSDEEAARIFARARAGEAASREDHARFASWLMIRFGRMDAAKGWTKQLHLGVIRNLNSRLFRKVGPDTGFDSLSDAPQARSLGAYLDALDATGELPKMVLYNLNPSDNYLFATMAGNFMDGSVAGKVQWGSGWWYLDQRQGIEWQLEALAQLGLLRRFVGMLTDSRSFLSYTRHEYFRRILCNRLGSEADRGLIPRDMDLLGSMVREICFTNARDFFGQPVGYDSTPA